MKFDLKIEEIKYLKILYNNIDGINKTTKAAVKNLNAREIIACGKNQEDFNTNVPQEVSLEFVYNDGIYKTKTTLKSFEKHDPYQIFIFETPENFEHEQNREYYRVLLNVDCIYKFRIDDNIREYKAKTYDISANGISLLLPENFTTEKPVTLTFSINNKLLQLNAKQVRSEVLNNSYKISFTFINISEKDKDSISQFCFQKQLEDRRNSLI